MDQKKALNMDEMEKVSGGSTKEVTVLTQVRSGAGKSYTQVTTLTRGTKVFYTGTTSYNSSENTTWYKISSPAVGWVLSSALQ